MNGFHPQQLPDVILLAVLRLRTLQAEHVDEDQEDRQRSFQYKNPLSTNIDAGGSTFSLGRSDQVTQLSLVVTRSWQLEADIARGLPMSRPPDAPIGNCATVACT